MSPSIKVYTLAEVSKHNSPYDYWLIIDGTVYDVTKFLEDHPAATTCSFLRQMSRVDGSPNPWHVSFSYARALQNTCLKTWGGSPENVKMTREVLLIRAKSNSLAQLGNYTGRGRV